MTDAPIKRALLRLLALLISTVPVAVAVISYFPLWRGEGAASVISGFSALLLALCALPLFRYVRDRLRSPSAHVMWLIIFLIFFTLSRIADEMSVISLVGFVSNLIASFIFRRTEDKRE